MTRRLILRNPSGTLRFESTETALALLERHPVVDAKNYYRFLELKPTASNEEVRLRGRELAKKYHPDAGGSVTAFLKLQEVLGVLLKPESRRIYDDMTPFDMLMNGVQTQHVARVLEPAVENDERPSDHWSYFEEEGLESTEDDMRRMSEWHDMLCNAARRIGWASTIRVGIVHLSGRFEIEWRWNEPVFLLGVGVEPSQEDAGVVVAYAASGGDFSKMLQFM